MPAQPHLKPNGNFKFDGGGGGGGGGDRGGGKSLWPYLWPFSQPLHDINDYFGQEVRYNPVHPHLVSSTALP